MTMMPISAIRVSINNSFLKKEPTPMAKVQKGRLILISLIGLLFGPPFYSGIGKKNLSFVISTYAMKSIAYTQERYNAEFGF